MGNGGSGLGWGGGLSRAGRFSVNYFFSLFFVY